MMRTILLASQQYTWLKNSINRSAQDPLYHMTASPAKTICNAKIKLLLINSKGETTKTAEMFT